MTFAALSNIIVSILCALVVLQSTRMMRNIRDMKTGNLGETVKSLDRATAHARSVLAELKVVLTTEGAENARSIASGEALRDELSLMVGIGNAVADRIMEAAETSERVKDDAAREAREAADAAEPEPAAAPAAKVRRSRAKVSTPAHTWLQ